MSVTETGTRARQPDESGFATAGDGARLYWEAFGGGATTVVLLPNSPISHSRLWKAQVHHLARHHRVVVYDGRGNGRSAPLDRPLPETYRSTDTLAVMDATGTERAVLVGLCTDGVWPSVHLAAEHPERVQAIFAIAPGAPLLGPRPAHRMPPEHWDADVTDPEGWEKENRGHILRDPRDFLEFWFGALLPEPHSTKQLEDAVAYGLDGSAQALVTDDVPVWTTRAEAEELCRRVRCPVVVVHGDQDACQTMERGLMLAALTGAEHVTLEGVGHVPNARHPVLINRLIGELVARVDPAPAPTRRWARASARPRRALLVSSPIGLGHGWRDVAIARELRAQVPGLEVHWLAQPPLTTLLGACGETVHPASAQLAAEASHVDALGGRHELHAFNMIRTLDEIFCANFMVFHDLVSAEPFDVWIGDEAWEVDYFLHENPELKTAPFAWLSDFVGFVPMASGGEREALLTADYNADMLEQRARFPHVRDRSIFVGDREDVVDAEFGPGLGSIRAWTNANFDYSGYICGPGANGGGREAAGFGPDERVCVVSAGGSGVGQDLLRLAIAAYPEAKRLVPELRMVVVAGPRIDPATLPSADGLEVRPYVHELGRQLAVCDLAITHGGLSTTMELTAAGRPFITFPLKDHFEQNVHVAHRLARYGAGRSMTFDDTTPAALAQAIAEEIGRETRYAPVANGGAARAAGLIAELL